MSSIRRAAVAGAFYPGDARTLAADVLELLDGVDSFEARIGVPKALVVPHAGYIYSGPVAARAYDELAGARGIVRRVVLLGPVHRVPVRGLALPGADAFETPLGRVPVDADAVASLRDLPQVVTSAEAHRLEHSLEVQLPFLQRALGEFTLVPLAVGDATPAQVAEVLERLWGGPETLVLISTDLSHYHAYEDARRIDAETVERITARSADLDHERACGATPLNGLLSIARRRSLPVRLLAACNSGDTAGGKGRVVGYASFALHDGDPVSADEAGWVLLDIARDTVARRLGLAQAAPQPRREAWLGQPGATFVTLKKDGVLRGCIGSLSAERALGTDVAANAEAAAFRDPRFPAMTAEEWSRCRTEVSLLSRPKPIRFADEADLLDQVSAGEDGLIIELDGLRGTFLPQVWESLPDKRRFVDELMRKAGLPAGARLARCRVSRYRVQKWIEPEPGA